MGRTNIVLDDDLIREAMEITGATTKREVVEIALQRLVSRHHVYDGIRQLKGRAPWDGDLDTWRRARE